MCKKHECLISAILKDGDKTITSIIKLCYMIDLVATRRLKNKISNFEYIRYNYGPFDERVYIDLKEMQKNGNISTYTEFGPRGDEIVLYALNDALDDSTVFSKEESEIVKEVLDSLHGYGPKNLTELTYTTAPMRALNATLGGTENIGVKLDLSLV